MTNEVTPLRAEGRDRYRTAARPLSDSTKFAEAQAEFEGIKSERDELWDACRKQAIDLDTIEQRVNLLESELRRVNQEHKDERQRLQLKADEFHRGFLTVQLELGTIASQATALSSAALEAINRAKQEMRKSGVEPDQTSLVDVDVAAIGAKFGVDSRTE